MANALGLKIESQAIEGEPPFIRFQYEVLFIDHTLGVVQPLSVHFLTDANVTPQQFRTAFTEAILATAAANWPTMVLNPGDCMIDVMQRGN